MYVVHLNGGTLVLLLAHLLPLDGPGEMCDRDDEEAIGPFLSARISPITGVEGGWGGPQKKTDDDDVPI